MPSSNERIPCSRAPRNSSATRASSYSVRKRALLTWPYTSMSDQRTGQWCTNLPTGSVARQLAVGHRVRPGRLGTEPVHLVLLVRLEVALEPEPAGRVLVVALPGQDVRGDPVEEHPVVGDDHRAAREVQQRVLQRAQRLHVEVVGGLVEQDHVAADLQRQRQVEPVALAAGPYPGRLLLVRAFETERGDVRPRRHLDLADHQVVQAVGDDLPHGLPRVQPGARLIDVGQLDGLADAYLAAVRLLQPDDGLEQGGLTDAVGADDADDAVARQG